jgi:8-oxo-dGTP pyrophosphatase MutT (NUDIX family)
MDESYAALQMQLNLQSAPDELWDVLDAQRRPTGRTHRRGAPMPEGDYHLIVHVWIVNSRGELFITRRAPTKGWPLFWETPGGSATAGEDSLAAALREAEEETGIALLPGNGQCVFSLLREDNFCDVWLFRQEVSLAQFVPQPGETIDAMLADAAQIREMTRDGRFIPTSYMEELFALC